MSLPVEAGSAIGAGKFRWAGGREAGPMVEVAAQRQTRFTARLHRDIAAVGVAWRALEAGGHATAYQRLDWLTCVCDHLAAPSRATPLFVEVRDAVTGEIVLILPLATMRRFGIAIVAWLDLGVCDYAAPLMAPGLVLSAEEAEQTWAAVLAVLPHADLIDVRQVPADVAGIANPLAQLRACRPGGLRTFGVGLEGDPKTLMRRLMTPKAYRNLARRESRLGERGAVRLIEATTEADIATLFAVMVEQRRHRFQTLGRFDLLSRPAVAAFYRDAALRSLETGGAVRMFGLSLDGEWISAAYMLVHSGSVYGIILSIAGEEWNNVAPGLIMAARIMEWSLAAGHVYFDMTVGSLSFKGSLGAQSRTLYRILEPRSARGRLAIRIITAASSATAWLERHPTLAGTIRTARRRLRRLAARSRS